MMSKINERPGLSIRYRNHSRRAITVHLLRRAQIPDKRHTKESQMKAKRRESLLSLVRNSAL